MHDELVAFLTGERTDDRGRLISDMVSWSDYQLETCHDYIQWVFPNRMPSRINPAAPTLDDDTIGKIQESDAALSNIRRMPARMYGFYEIEFRRFEDYTYQLELANPSTPPRWISTSNHNLLRLSRNMLCLKDLGLESDSDTISGFLDVILMRHRTLIGPETITHWRQIWGALDHQQGHC